MHNLVETPLEGSCDVFIHEQSPSLGSDDSVLPNPLDHLHPFPLFSVPSPSRKNYINAPMGNLMICDAIMDLGYEDNMVNVFDGNVDDYMSLGT